jgi:hypothetical protein
MSEEDYLDHLTVSRKWHQLDEFKKQAVLTLLGSREMFEALSRVNQSLYSTRSVEIVPEPVILENVKAYLKHKTND